MQIWLHIFPGLSLFVKKFHISGACSSQPIAPVCGTNGINYDNDCFAREARMSIQCSGRCPCHNQGKDRSSNQISLHLVVCKCVFIFTSSRNLSGVRMDIMVSMLLCLWSWEQVPDPLGCAQWRRNSKLRRPIILYLQDWRFQLH